MIDFDYGRRFREIEQHMIDDSMARWYPKRTMPVFEDAWREMLEALPDGWVFEKLYRRERYWSAWARNANPPIGPGLPGLRGDSARDSDNPIEALVALTAELRDVRDRSQ